MGVAGLARVAVAAFEQRGRVHVLLGEHVVDVADLLDERLRVDAVLLVVGDLPHTATVGLVDGLVNSTCYFLSVAAKGNALAPALEEGQDVLIHATGYDAAGKETGTVTMTFASKDKLIKEWTKWDLSSLGKVAKVRFNMTGGPDNGYGFSMPAYYALDDITIEL